MQPTGGAVRKIVQLLQCLLGVATVFALAWLGWSLLPDEPSVGWAAAFGLAVYPGDVHDAVQPQTGLWAAAAVVALLALAGASRWRTIPRAALLAGCLAAAVGGAWLAGDFPLFGPSRLDRFAAIACVALASIGLCTSLPRWRRLWPAYAVFAAAALTCLFGRLPLRAMAPVAPIAFFWAATALAPPLARLVPRRTLRVYRPGERGEDPFGRGHVLRGPHYDTQVRRRAG